MVNPTSQLIISSTGVICDPDGTPVGSATSPLRVTAESVDSSEEPVDLTTRLLLRLLLHRRIHLNLGCLR